MTEQVVVCPQCSAPVVRHCDADQCDWLACTTCKIIFGRNAYILYGRALAREDEARKRRNGA